MNQYPTFAAAFLLILSAAGGAPAQQEINKYAQEFYHDFRGKPLPKELHLTGKREPEFLKFEPEGLRVTLPETFIHEFGGVSVRSSFGFKGDFEITAGFEILHADVPGKGFGVGASMHMAQAQPGTQMATLARVVRAGPSQVLVWERTPNKGEKYLGGVRKCSDKVLRLRFRRAGSTLHYLWAPGLEGGEFEEIGVQKEFGDADMNAVRINTITGREPCKADVRFIDFRIRSGGAAAEDAIAVAPPAPNNLAPSPPTESSTRGWLSAAAIIGGALVLVFTAILGVALFLRRGKAEPKGELAAITFACPACGKSIKAKASTAGKKIACSKCRQMVKVPLQRAIKQAD